MTGDWMARVLRGCVAVSVGSNSELQTSTLELRNALVTLNIRCDFSLEW